MANIHKVRTTSTTTMMMTTTLNVLLIGTGQVETSLRC